MNWEPLLTVEAAAVNHLVVAHPPGTDPKLQIRGFTVKFDGTQQRLEPLITVLRRNLIKYVFPESSRPEDIDWGLARDKFGDIDPKSDGKLGEMLLYVFVEAYLRAPLMAYKLKDLGNPNDQVKGADGVFLGTYANQPALLIGESKVHNSVESALGSALTSLQRFHDGCTPYTNELLIARKYPAERQLDPDMLRAAVDLIDGTANRIIVHPVFISYDVGEIAAICSKATCAVDAEEALAQLIVALTKSWKAKISSRQSKCPKPFQVFLDFFFLPCEDTLALREAFYVMLHGHPYESTAVKVAVNQIKRELASQPKPAVRKGKVVS